MCSLLGLEYFARNAARAAVDPGSCNVDTPALGGRAEHGEVVRERFSAEPPVANIGHLILNARFVLRMADASRVDEEPANLRVLGEGRIDARILRVGAYDRCGHVVEHDALGDTIEEAPGCVETLAKRFNRLPERRPHELIDSVTMSTQSLRRLPSAVVT